MKTLLVILFLAGTLTGWLATHMWKPTLLISNPAHREVRRNGAATPTAVLPVGIKPEKEDDRPAKEPAVMAK